jgi:AAA15 family ATPase/GTPase
MNRTMAQSLLERINEADTNITLIIGNNNTGKTALLKSLLDENNTSHFFEGESERIYWDKEWNVLQTSSGVFDFYEYKDTSKDWKIAIDEIETGLDPANLLLLLDKIVEVSKLGFHFYISTYSYFVIKKLELLALQQEVGITVVNTNNNTINNINEIASDNFIVDTSIALYREYVDLV